MSLEKDFDLINQLLKIGQQATQTVAPTAQPVDTSALKNMGLKLVNNLSQQLSAPGDEFVSEKANAELNTKSLENFPSFLNFIIYNGISYQGKKLIIKHTPSSAGDMNSRQGNAEFKLLSPADQAAYVKYPTVEDSDDDDFQYYIYKDGMEKYLQDLLTKSDEKSGRGRILKPYITKLISEVESNLKISLPAPAAPGTKPGQTGQAGTVEQSQSGQGNPYQPASYNTSTQTGQGAGNGTSNEQRLMPEDMPLVPDVIMFDRIKTFATKMQYLTQNQIIGQILAIINKLETSYPTINSLDLNTNSFDKIKSLVTSTGSAGNPIDLLSTTESLLTQTYQALSVLSRFIQTNSQRYGYLQEAVNQQIQGVYMNNNSGLNSLLSEMKSSMQGNRR